MPFIEVRNWPCHKTEEWQMSMANALRSAAVEAAVPGITAPHLVTVTFGGSALMALPDNQTVGIIVDFLFEKPDRTKDVLNRLAECLHIAAREYFRDSWRIEVIVRPFNTETGAYRTD
ncbi:MAG: hypothetical protein Q7S96_05025 [bacterium]|nr:hypothetical protein [bacterium]